jgi:hypothetical protein
MYIARLRASFGSTASPYHPALHNEGKRTGFDVFEITGAGIWLRGWGAVQGKRRTLETKIIRTETGSPVGDYRETNAIADVIARSCMACTCCLGMRTWQ